MATSTQIHSFLAQKYQCHIELLTETQDKVDVA